MRVHHMQHKHHVPAALAAVLTLVVVLAIGGGATPAWAATQQPASPATSAAPAVPAQTVSATSIVTKVVLPETSIDGPAFSGIVSTFESQTTNRSVIGWTGTDAAHHLNVETSTDGLHFGHKLILRDTSPFRPDVTQMSEAAGGQVSVAWTGSDVNHSLNVLFDVYSSKPLKLTLRNENSFTAPAVLQIGSTIYLAWTGTNAAHSLNILPITFTGTSLVVGRKIILSAFSSNAGPHLSQRDSDVVLNWTSRVSHLTVATSHDGVHFANVTTSAETSAFAPGTAFLPPQQPGARDWLGWTGMDAAHHLNLEFAPTAKAVLSDTAFGGPALGINTPEIAWTGTDAAHHLNIARFVMQ